MNVFNDVFTDICRNLDELMEEGRFIVDPDCQELIDDFEQVVFHVERRTSEEDE